MTDVNRSLTIISDVDHDVGFLGLSHLIYCLISQMFDLVQSPSHFNSQVHLNTSLTAADLVFQHDVSIAVSLYLEFFRQSRLSKIEDDRQNL